MGIPFKACIGRSTISKQPCPSGRGFWSRRIFVPPLRYGLPFLPALPSGASWQVFGESSTGPSKRLRFKCRIIVGEPGLSNLHGVRDEGAEGNSELSGGRRRVRDHTGGSVSTKERLSADYTRKVESPFLDEDHFVGESEQEWEPRVAALVAESPFRGVFEAFEERPRVSIVPEVCKEETPYAEEEREEEDFAEDASFMEEDEQPDEFNASEQDEEYAWELDEQETEISEECEAELDDETGSGDHETLEFDTPSPRSTTGTHAKPVDFNTAKNVMWEVIRIVNRQHDVKSADPERSTTTEPWFRQYKPLLKEWYLLTYGETSGTSRIRLKGDALRVKLEAVVTMTQPLLDVLKAKGGKEWSKQLGSYVYARIADFEYEAVETMPTQGSPSLLKPVEFPKQPKAVSLDEFFGVVAKQESQPVEISRGVGRYSLGTATVGAAFSASQQDHRVLLWSNGQAVLFMRDGTIYAQSARMFSEDIIMGAFVLAAQNALGSAILAQLMVEVALSFTPWGILADGVFALEALTRGSWKEAALTLLPGPAIGLAGKTRAVRATVRGAKVAATIGAQVVKRTIRFIGRGAYRVRDKLLRGIWIIGESGGTAGKSSYRFFDEVGKLWHEIPETTALRYVKCSTCRFTPKGKGEAVKGAVDEIIEDLRQARAYSSRGRVLVNRKLIEDVVEAYGPWGPHVVEQINNTWSSMSNGVKLFDDSLRIAKDLSRIKGARGYMDAVDIFEDLASSSVHTARGTMFELRWAAKHVDEIAALGIPVSRKGWVGKGLDVLKKSGEAVELKNFNFTSEFYHGDPGRSVARIIKQVESRLKYKDVTKVTVIFSSEAGKMPAVFHQQLRAAMTDLAKRLRRKSADITFRFWP